VPNNHFGYGLVDALAAVNGTADLIGTVGPGFVINLRHPDGTDLTSIPEGQYSILVHDLGSAHNFHLQGSGVDEATDIAGTGDATWDVSFVPGAYTFVCDAHSGTMNGSFTVTAAPPPPPPPPPSVRCHVPRVIGLALGRQDTDPQSALLRGPYPPRSLEAPGRVIGQSPRPGAVKRRGFPVKLVVGRR
jgi:hypothetical protein